MFADMNTAAQNVTQPVPDRLLTVSEAAVILKLTPWGVREAIRRGDLPAVRLGERGHLRIPEAALEAALHQEK
jgi:excisionase family DNA binding protein